MSQIAWSERPAYGIESDAFARAWNRAFRSRLQVRDYTTWSHTEVGALVHISGQLHPRSLLAEPIRVRPHWSTPSIIGALRSNAHRSLSEIGHEGDNGKIDAFVSKAVRPLLDRLAVKEDLEARSGLKLSDEPTLQYATYRHAGAHIDLHLDTANYGDLTAILCLDYQWCNPESEPSATLLFTPEGLQTVALQPGELLVFDGSTTPHARTPLTQGEAITLLILGYKVASEPQERRLERPAGSSGVREVDELVADLHSRAVRHCGDVTAVSNLQFVPGSALLSLVSVLERASPLPEARRWTPRWLSPAILTGLRRNADLERDRHSASTRSGKIESSTGPTVSALLNKVDVAGDVIQSCGLGRPLEMTAVHYAHYARAGACLNLHPDVAWFGDITLLVCLDRKRTSSEAPSATVLLSSGGARLVDLDPGEVCAFAGPHTYHGRTPLQDGEHVSMLIIVFRFREPLAPEPLRTNEGADDRVAVSR